MTSKPSKVISHLLPLIAFLFIANVGKGAEVEAWTKETFTKAGQGDAREQYNLGLMYDTGRGVPKDYKEAVTWWRKAAEQGDARAQTNLGLMYDNGRGVPQDYKEAVKWYRKAAEQGDSGAQFSLGLRYDNGTGVAQDYKEAVKWYRKAAEQGNSLAQISLGLRYYNGQGVPKDDVKAYAWFNVGSANGSDQGSKNRDSIAKDMTPEQIAKAQELSAKWFELYQPKE
jgi:uncharacterized protein